MPDYTESQIRELSGEQLRWATWELCQLPNCYDVLSLDVCVPLLMGEAGVLAGWSLTFEPQDGCWQVFGVRKSRVSEIESDDPATAICRAACLVALREGE